MLLKVHRSCFRMEGFVSEVPLRELARLGREAGLPVVEDRGSGTLVDLRERGLPEPPAWAPLDEGADLVVFSGDKLLGGPQAGIALGRAELIARLRSNPLARALRVDKLTLAGLDWTLRALLEGRELEIPVLRMLLAPRAELERRARQLATGLEEAGWKGASVVEAASAVGGGALPGLELEGAVVRLDPGEGRAEQLAEGLRRGRPAVLVRIQRGAIVLDPRTLEDSDVAPVLEALAAHAPPR
jgi:L-seryl-tRNA(Ser) seleniumtransferase